MKSLEISHYTLSFTKQREETKYRIHELDSDVLLLRYISLLAFLIELLYCTKDYFWSGEVPIVVVTFRFFYLTPLMLLSFILTYSDRIKNNVANMHFISILMMISLVLGQYYMTAMNDSIGSSFAKTLPLIFFSTYLFTGIKFKHIVYVTPWLILSFCIVIMYYEKIPVSVKINDSVLVLMNLILAMFFKYILEMNRRKSYIRQLIIEVNEHKLEDNLRDEKTLSSLRKDLIGILAHDIRAPLGNLQSIISLLDAKTISSEKGVELLGKVNERIKVIAKGVNDLLIWVKSKEEGLELDISEFSVQELINEILKIGKEQIEIKKIEIVVNVDDGLLISTDKGILQTILRNLLSNAIKFSNTSGEIFVNAKIKGNNVFFEVKDAGIGMNVETTKKIREVFYSTPGTHKEPGVGLGLQICFTLLEKLNTELQIDSEIGKGTSMSFKLGYVKK